MKNNRTEIRKVFRSTDRGTEIRVFVIPRSSQCGITGTHDGALKIKLTKPPVDGQANAECCKVVAKHLGVPKSQVRVASGKTSRRKVLLVEGVSEEEVSERIKYSSQSEARD